MALSRNVKHLEFERVQMWMQKKLKTTVELGKSVDIEKTALHVGPFEQMKMNLK